MKVMLLASEAPEDFALRDNKEKFDAYMGEWYAYGDAMTKEGVFISGAPLEPPSSATVVSVRNGVRKVEDGPFPDAKEQLGGFFIIDTADMNAAADWAARCPAAKNGVVEARPVMEYEGEE
ncbi:YciI family protein [Hyphococcus flavus]|uniref:YciI family protein n=1 Tax=Hyphococcus flavus TaxID=1866326 RepID=A0AAF0CGT3_9PROT|nr:YciI family protein [Hyphococcus flavus]WDI31077.1 YciI family protein [Hyphococcus flavus]